MSITPKDLVLYGGKDGTYSGGYKIDNFLKSQGVSPLTTFNTNNFENLKGGKNKGLFDDNNSSISDLFNGLGVPAGLSNLIDVTMKNEYKDELSNEYQRSEAGLITKDLYDKLLALTEPSNNDNIDYNKDYEDELEGGSKKKKKRITRRKNIKNTKQSNSSGKKNRKTRRGH